MSSSGKKHRLTFKNVGDNLYKVFGTQSTVSIMSPSLRGTPFSGIEWTYQARDLGFKEEIESDEEGENMANAKVNIPEELEMSELGEVKKVQQVKGSVNTLDSIMEDTDIKL